MTTHTDKRPPETQPQPSAKDLFTFLVGLFHLVVYGFGAWWAMLTKKVKTVGTRAYWLDVAICWCVMTFCANNPAVPLFERQLFLAGWVLMLVLFWIHLQASYASKQHVHTKCLGKGWLGNGGDLILGLAVAFGFYANDTFYVAGFVAISAACNCIRDQMVLERDRQRAVHMDDAMFEQQYMVHNYHQQGKGRM